MMSQSTLAQPHGNRPHGDVILAGASVRSLAQSAIRDGLRPICIDMFNDADLQHWLQQCGLPDNLRCVTRFADVVHQLQDVRPEVPLIPVGGLENEADLIRQLRLQRPVWLSDEQSIQAVRDPETLFPVLQNHGCLVPEFRLQPPSIGTGRWLKKKLRSAGGRGIRLHDSDSQTPDSNAFWQEWIDGIPLSATFVNLPSDQHMPSAAERPAAERDMSASLPDAGGLQWLGCALQLSGCAELHASGFQFCGNAGPVKVSAKLLFQIQHTAQTIMRYWPLRGVFGLDFLISKGTVVLLEVNPRPTASHELHEMAAEQQPGHVVLHAAAWQESPICRSNQPAAAAVNFHPHAASDSYVRCVLYAARDLRLKAAAQQQLLNYSLTPPLVTAVAEAAIAEGASLDLQQYRPPALQAEWIHSAKPAGGLPTAWLADIPAAESMVAAGTPFCSIYLAIGRHSVDECHRELDKRVLQMLKMLPGNVALTLSKSLRKIREQISVLQQF